MKLRPTTAADAIRIARALVLPDQFPDQAPRGQQARELAYAGYDNDHPGWNLSPGSLLAAFVEAESGDPRRQVRMFNDIVAGDGTLRSLMLQRRQAVAGKPWLIQPANDKPIAQKAAAALRFGLNAESTTRAFEHLLDFNKHGYMAAEIMWSVVRVDGRLWVVPAFFLPVRADRFVIGDPSALTGRVDQLRIITGANMARGEALLPGKWVVLDRADPTLAEGALMRTAAWCAMGKRFAFRDWLIFSEKFGIPLVTAKYDTESGTDEKIKQTATDIVRKMGGDGGAIMPKSIDVEIVEAGRTSDNSAAHGGLIAYCNAEMSKLINGSTLASDNSGNSGASYALGAIHNSVRWDNVIYDASRLIVAFQSQIAAAFMRFNGLDEGDAPNLHIQVVRDETPAQRVLMATQLKTMGVAVKPSQLYSETGFNQPEPGSADATDPAFVAAPPKTDGPK